jgi:hypothetical protein
MFLAPKIQLTSKEKVILTKYSNSHTEASRLVERSKIILLAATGKTNIEIGTELRCSPLTVAKWRNRFVSVNIDDAESLARINIISLDAERSGRPCTVSNVLGEKIIKKTITETPEDGTTHWSCRNMAESIGVSKATVHRIWRAHQLKPHLIRTFKLSNDPQFYDKLKDVIGIITNPPENSIVYSVDEKTNIQALDKTQRAFLMKEGNFVKEIKGHNCTKTHDYKRHGTTTLLAGYDIASGRVVGFCHDKHTNSEWIKLLNIIDKDAPKDKDVHLVLDNYATHKHENVINWLNKHKRFHLHFTPTSSSWCNPIERWFRELTEKAIKRGNFRSVKVLIDAIMNFIVNHNMNPKAYKWNAKFEVILQKIARARAALATLAAYAATAEDASQELLAEAAELTMAAEKARAEADRAMAELNEASEATLLQLETEAA